MPVHHLGLAVSHIPSATSFYLQTLQPLGYHFVGQHGDSIGLGVQGADLFLTQEPRGASVSPTHIAFAADNCLAVRDCYAAALSAGAYPSGAPSYRNSDATVFSAAVEDLDGNVIEFVFREGVESEQSEGTVSPNEDRQVIAWQKDVADSGLHDDLESTSSMMSRAKLRVKTAMDLASTASKSVRSASDAEPGPGITRAATTPSSLGGDFPSKAFFGTILGAAAGAALMFAVTRSEGENAKEEAAFEASKISMSSRGKPATVQTVFDARDARPHRNFSVTESRVSRPPKSHRNFSVTESAYSKPKLPQPPRSMRAIEQAEFFDEDEVREAISRFASSRRPPGPRRSKTTDALDYVPVSRSAGRIQAGDSSTSRASSSRHLHSGKSRHYDRRSEKVALPSTKEQLLLEAPPTKSTFSRHSTRRSRYTEDDDQDTKRRDSGVSFGSHKPPHSKHGGDERSHASRRSESTIKPSRKGSSHYESAATMPLPESKPPSDYRSRHSDTGDRRSRRSESTIGASRKASSQYESAAGVALPGSQAPLDHRSRHTEPAEHHSHASKRSESTVRPPRKGSSYHASVAGVALPESRTSSQVSDARSSRRTNAAGRESRRSSHHPKSEPPRELEVEVFYSNAKAASHASRHSHKHDFRRERISYRPSSSRSKHASPSRYESAHEVPLPPSKGPSSLSARDFPVPESHGNGWEEVADESDGMGDMTTVVPDDSISCIDLPKPSTRSSGGRSSRRRESKAAGGKEREYGERYSAATLPVRGREGKKDRDGKRSVFSFA